jgi:hypothetical protein
MQAPVASTPFSSSTVPAPAATLPVSACALDLRRHPRRICDEGRIGGYRGLRIPDARSGRSSIRNIASGTEQISDCAPVGDGCRVDLHDGRCGFARTSRTLLLTPTSSPRPTVSHRGSWGAAARARRARRQRGEAVQAEVLRGVPGPSRVAKERGGRRRRNVQSPGTARSAAAGSSDVSGRPSGRPAMGAKPAAPTARSAGREPCIAGRASSPRAARPRAVERTERSDTSRTAKPAMRGSRPARSDHQREPAGAALIEPSDALASQRRGPGVQPEPAAGGRSLHLHPCRRP